MSQNKWMRQTWSLMASPRKRQLITEVVVKIGVSWRYFAIWKMAVKTAYYVCRWLSSITRVRSMLVMHRCWTATRRTLPASFVNSWRRSTVAAARRLRTTRPASSRVMRQSSRWCRRSRCASRRSPSTLLSAALPCATCVRRSLSVSSSRWRSVTVARARSPRRLRRLPERRASDDVPSDVAHTLPKRSVPRDMHLVGSVLRVWHAWVWTPIVILVSLTGSILSTSVWSSYTITLLFMFCIS